MNRILFYLTKITKMIAPINALLNKLMEIIEEKGTLKIEINKFFGMCLKANIINNKHAAPFDP